MLTIPNFYWCRRLLEIPQISQTSLYSNEVSSTGLSGVHSSLKEEKKCWRGAMSHTTNLTQWSGLLFTSLQGTKRWETSIWSSSYSKSGRGKDLTALTLVFSIRERNTHINLETVSVGVVGFGKRWKSKRFYKNLIFTPRSAFLLPGNSQIPYPLKYFLINII